MPEHSVIEHAYKGRAWVLVGREPYTRKDGTVTELLRWQTPCAVCGTLFEIKTSVAHETSKAFGAKHCAAHKLTQAQVTVLRNAGKAAKKAGADLC